MLASYGRPLNLTQSRTPVTAAVGGTNVGDGTTDRMGDGATGIKGADEYLLSTWHTNAGVTMTGGNAYYQEDICLFIAPGVEMMDELNI